MWQEAAGGIAGVLSKWELQSLADTTPDTSRGQHIEHLGNWAGLWLGVMAQLHISKHVKFNQHLAQ